MPNRIHTCEDSGIEVNSLEYQAYRKGQADLLQAFRLASAKEMNKLPSPGIEVQIWREARRLLSELANK